MLSERRGSHDSAIAAATKERKVKLLKDVLRLVQGVDLETRSDVEEIVTRARRLDDVIETVLGRHGGVDLQDVANAAVVHQVLTVTYQARMVHLRVDHVMMLKTNLESLARIARRSQSDVGEGAAMTTGQRRSIATYLELAAAMMKSHRDAENGLAVLFVVLVLGAALETRYDGHEILARPLVGVRGSALVRHVGVPRRLKERKMQKRVQRLEAYNREAWAPLSVVQQTSFKPEQPTLCQELGYAPTQLLASNTIVSMNYQ